ncbi:hypothetical protein WJX73_006028 [Symbiochloris irregularis]|uniref:NADH dehydrogenase [ubiquinone] iron-sulfur protein 5 n=1 Tax=Symbiochloris irregularis TaxID=706552 RepID=A0AAW1P9N5_9CHLO
MASGFGLTGSTGRCYGVWTEFSECMRETTDPGHCRNLRDDYLECLHHRKEYTRLNAVYRERKKQLAAGVDKVAW